MGRRTAIAVVALATLAGTGCSSRTPAVHGGPKPVAPSGEAGTTTTPASSEPAAVTTVRGATADTPSTTTRHASPSSTPQSEGNRQGTIAGTVVASGGPSRNSQSQPVADDQVQCLDDAGNTVVSAMTGSDGSFTMLVAAGHYTLREQYGTTSPVDVVAGQTSRVVITVHTP